MVIGSAILFGCDPTSEQGFSPNPSKPSAIADADHLRLHKEADSPEDTRSSAKIEITIPRIVAFGNSLTAGRGVSTDESYPAQLQKRLDEAGYRYSVINAGVSGDTTAGGLRRLSWVLRSEPKMVILELGANDGLRGLPLEQTRSNLEKIIQRLLAKGVTIILTGMKLPPNYGPEYTGRFFEMYGELAEQYKLTDAVLSGGSGDSGRTEPSRWNSPNRRGIQNYRQQPDAGLGAVTENSHANTSLNRARLLHKQRSSIKLFPLTDFKLSFCCQELEETEL